MQEICLRVINEVGLHARPASQFVQMANQFLSNIQVRNLTSAGTQVNAKSILGVLSIGVQRDQEIEITAIGPDEKEAVRALRDLIEHDFDIEE